jgi:hypothetical protein
MVSWHRVHGTPCVAWTGSFPSRCRCLSPISRDTCTVRIFPSTWNLVRGSDFPEPSETDAGVVAMSNGNWVPSYRNEFGEILVAYATTGGSSIAARSASADAPATRAPSFTVKKTKR